MMSKTPSIKQQKITHQVPKSNPLCIIVNICKSCPNFCAFLNQMICSTEMIVSILYNFFVKGFFFFPMVDFCYRPVFNVPMWLSKFDFSPHLGFIQFMHLFVHFYEIWLVTLWSNRQHKKVIFCLTPE